MLTGTVKTKVEDKGFGFIVADHGSEEYFFHFSACTGIRFDELSRGSRVSFRPGLGTKGPRAEDVSAI